MVVREEGQAPLPAMHQDEFTTDNFVASINKEKRRKGSSYHRYKTLRAKVKDVVGATSDFDTIISPNSVAAGPYMEKTDFDAVLHGDQEQLDAVFEDSRQPSPTQRGGPLIDYDQRIQKQGELDDEQQDLTDPTEWRKFIESVKREVAGPPSPLPPLRQSRRDATQDAREYYRSSTYRTPISFRRLLPFAKGEKRGDDDVAFQRSQQRPPSPRRRSRSPIKRSLSPLKFHKKTDPPSTERTDQVDASSNGMVKSRGSFRLPRFPSPGRRSPYAQLSKPKSSYGFPSKEVESETSYTNLDIAKEFANVQLPLESTNVQLPLESTNEQAPLETTSVHLPVEPIKALPIEPTNVQLPWEPQNVQLPWEPQNVQPPSEPTKAQVNSRPAQSQPRDETKNVAPEGSKSRKKGKKSRKKSSRSSPTTKPIPPEIQELNDQVMEAVGSGIHEDDDTTTGGLVQSTEGCTRDISTRESEDLLSNINISTTSGVQVKSREEKEDMLHQTIARRVLSVLIRPSPQATETIDTEVKDTANSDFADTVVSPSDIEYNDLPDEPCAKSIEAGTDATTSTLSTLRSKPNEKIREQLKALKAKTDKISLKKKAEKSRRKHQKSEKKKKGKSKRSSASKSKHADNAESTTSYESFDSLSSKNGGNCFTSTFCCCFDARGCCNEEEETVAPISREDSTGLYSDTSLDTYESEWVGRPLPILSPSDLSVDKDDMFDVMEKCVCGAN